jgi:hypothetical protein
MMHDRAFVDILFRTRAYRTITFVTTVIGIHGSESPYPHPWA